MDDKRQIVFTTSWESIEQISESLIYDGYFAEVKRGEPANIIRFFECELPEYMNNKFNIPDFQTGVRDLDNIRLGLEGYTHAGNRCSFLHCNLYDDSSKNAQRRLRSTAGHETFHCIGHVPAISNFISSHGASVELYRTEKRLPAYMNPEIQADIFSGCILMPRMELKRLHRRNNFSVEYLSDRFDVHPAFVRSRLKRNTIFK